MNDLNTVKDFTIEAVEATIKKLGNVLQAMKTDYSEECIYNGVRYYEIGELLAPDGLTHCVAELIGSVTSLERDVSIIRGRGKRECHLSFQPYLKFGRFVPVWYNDCFYSLLSYHVEREDGFGVRGFYNIIVTLGNEEREKGEHIILANYGFNASKHAER